jgi:AcrR family transcriptional regulator
MGRSQQFQIEDIQKGLCELLKRFGFGNFSMQLVAKELNIPIGSLYYRYESKNDMIADLWLNVIESFQNEFFDVLLSDSEPRKSGLSAALFVAEWMEREPEYAYLLAFVRKGDLNHKEWSSVYKLRDKKLQNHLLKNWQKWSNSLKDSNLSEQERFVIQTVIVDLPITVCRPFIGKTFPAYVEQFISDSYHLHLTKALKLK